MLASPRVMRFFLPNTVALVETNEEVMAVSFTWCKVGVALTLAGAVQTSSLNLIATPVDLLPTTNHKPTKELPQSPKGLFA